MSENTEWTYVYMVERNGVYQQGTIGIFTTEEKAIAAAKEHAAEEPDDYHAINVVRLAVDNICFHSDDECDCHKDIAEFNGKSKRGHGYSYDLSNIKIPCGRR